MGIVHTAGPLSVTIAVRYLKSTASIYQIIQIFVQNKDTQQQNIKRESDNKN